MFYFSGTIERDRVYSRFTLIKSSNPNVEITNVYDSFKQKMFADKQKKLYEWDIKEFPKAKIEPGTVIKCEYRSLDIFKEITKPEKSTSSFSTNDKNVSDEEAVIIDIKNTKSEIYFLNDEHILSQMSAYCSPDDNKLKLSLVQKNLISNQKIVKISCGSSHTLALTNKGVVYSWGSNANGRLGQGKTDDQNQPQMMYHLLGYNVVDISAGLGHNCVIGIDKKSLANQEIHAGYNNFPHVLLTWGNGAQGCLGTGNQKDMYIPTKVEFENIQIKEAYCGYSDISVLTYSGEIFTFGANDYGQLGIQTEDPVFSPVRVFFEEEIKKNKPVFIDKLFVGPFHKFAVSRDGIIYSWGLGSFGQLANNGLIVRQPIPVPINLRYKDQPDSGENELDDSDDGYKSLCPSRIKLSLQRLNIILNFDSSFLILQKKQHNINSLNFFPIKEDTLSSYKDESKISKKITANSQSDFQDETNDSSSIFLGGSRSIQGLKSMCAVNDNNHILTERREDNRFESSFKASNTMTSSTLEKSLSFARKTEDDEQSRMHQSRIQNMKKSKDDKSGLPKTKQKERRDQKESQMKKQWLEEIIPKWHEKRNSETIKNLAFLGIPTSIRSKVWALAIKNRLSITRQYFELMQMRGRMLSTKYQEYKKMLKENKDCKPIEQVIDDPLLGKLSKEGTIKIIEADLPRTFPTLPIFNSPESPIYQGLRDLLEAFASSRPDIGYIQGMSYVAGLLLLYMDPYTAFVCFSNIVTQPALLPFYMLEEEYINQKMDLYLVMLGANLTNVDQHLNSMNISPKMYIVEWFLTLFTKSLNPDLVSRVWDIFFIEGPITLYKAAIAILMELEEKLLDSEETDIMKILKNLSEHIKHEENIITNIKKVIVPNSVLQEFDKFENASTFSF